MEHHFDRHRVNGLHRWIGPLWPLYVQVLGYHIPRKSHKNLLDNDDQLIFIVVHIHQRAVELRNKRIVRVTNPRKLPGPTMVGKDLMNISSLKYIFQKFLYGNDPLHHHLATNHLSPPILRGHRCDFRGVKGRRRRFDTLQHFILIWKKGTTTIRPMSKVVEQKNK